MQRSYKTVVINLDKTHVLLVCDGIPYTCIDNNNEVKSIDDLLDLGIFKHNSMPHIRKTNIEFKKVSIPEYFTGFIPYTDLKWDVSFNKRDQKKFEYNKTCYIINEIVAKVIHNNAHFISNVKDNMTFLNYKGELVVSIAGVNCVSDKFNIALKAFEEYVEIKLRNADSYNDNIHLSYEYEKIKTSLINLHKQ